MKLTHQQNQSDIFIKNYEDSILFIGDKKYNYNIILSEKKDILNLLKQSIHSYLSMH